MRTDPRELRSQNILLNFAGRRKSKKAEERSARDARDRRSEPDWRLVTTVGASEAGGKRVSKEKTSWSWRENQAFSRSCVFGGSSLFTTEGELDDKAIYIGDRLRIGSAEFVVTQPRMPCFKLGLRFGRVDMTKRFLRSGRAGFYFAVLQEGEVAAGDSIALVARDERRITVADIANLYIVDATNQELLHRAIELPALPESWRDYFRKRVWNPDN